MPMSMYYLKARNLEVQVPIRMVLLVVGHQEGHSHFQLHEVEDKQFW